MKIISYYTKGTPYELDGLSLKKTLTQFQLDFEIKNVSSLSSTKENRKQKSKIILDEMYNLSNGNILVYLDINARLTNIPTLLTSVNYDISYHYIEPLQKILTNTLYFNINETTKNIVKQWVTLNEDNDLSEQFNFQTVIKNNTNLNSYILPSNYCFINNNWQKKQLNNTLPIISYI
jgi:glutamate mutase epsilon subunit